MTGRKRDALAHLRLELDSLYDSLFPLLARRARLVREIGKEKKRLALPVRDAAREREVLGRCRASLEASGESADVIARTTASLKSLMASARTQENAAKRAKR